MSDGSINTGAVNVARLYQVSMGGKGVKSTPDLSEAEALARRLVDGGGTDVTITEYAEAASVGILMQRLEAELWAIAEHAVAVGVPSAISSLPTVAAAMRIIREQGLEAYRAEKVEAAHG